MQRKWKLKDEFFPVKFKDVYRAVETELHKRTEMRSASSSCSFTLGEIASGV